MKKIILFIIIVIVSYVLVSFIKPDLAKTIDSLIGMDGFSESIVTGRDIFNGAMTDIPSINEVKNTYSNTLSGALEIKNTVVGGIKDTKATIDTVRETLSGAQDTYNDAKDIINKTTDTLDGLKETFNDIEGISDKIQGGVNTKIMQ